MNKDIYCDGEAIWISLFGLKLISKALKVLPEEQIDREEFLEESIRVGQKSIEWVNEISTEVFNWFVHSSEVDVLTDEIEYIKHALKIADNYDYHEDVFYRYYIDEEIKDSVGCGLCMECSLCKNLIEDLMDSYFAGYRVYKMKVSLDDRIKVADIPRWILELIPNLISDKFTRENVAYNIDINEEEGVIEIEYVDDDSEYFAHIRDEEVNENLRAVNYLIDMIDEGLI